MDAIRCTMKIPVEHDPRTAVVTDPDTGTDFLRTTCINCRRWLGDRKVPLNGVGTGGNSVAEFCRKEIGSIFRASKVTRGEDALRELVAELSRRTEHTTSGSTLSLVFILDNPCIASVAVLGDSPVVIYDGKKLHISPEHNIRTNLEERAVAEKRGGTYSGGYLFGPIQYDLGLQMSRALGDSWMGEVLSRIPDVYMIKNPHWILVASDGLFDPTHRDTKRLLSQIEMFAVRNASAKDLMRWAEHRGPIYNNATAVVWHI